MITARAMLNQVRQVTAGFEGRYDNDAIVRDLIDAHGLVDIDVLEHDEFWLIALKHQTTELWNTERVRQELGASSIRSAMRIILRLGLEPVSREPGRSGMNLYEADAVRAAIAGRPGHGQAQPVCTQSVPETITDGSAAGSGAEK